MSDKVIRIFPRRTKATPTDDLAIVNRLPNFWDDADKIEISVTFEWDIPRAEELAKTWGMVAPVSVGGPAYGNAGGDFTPGLYLRHGYTITSRGCPNHCRHCLVPIREGQLRLLPIRDGYDILDNNLLACPREHIESVFMMLEKQSKRAKFTGGLEAARLRQWHIDWFVKLRPEAIWTAYDRPDEWEPLCNAVKMMAEAGIVAPHKSKRVGCYVLMGWRSDTLCKAEERLKSVINLGIKTQAMWLNNGQESKPEDASKWRDLRRHYTDAFSVGGMVASTWK